MGPGAGPADLQPARNDVPGDRALEVADQLEPVRLRRLFELPADLSRLSRRGEAARLCRGRARARIAAGADDRRLLRSIPAADQSRPRPLCAGAGAATAPAGLRDGNRRL